jgi:hypothetical protein
VVVGEMDHDFVFFECSDPILALADVAFDQFDAGGQRRGAVMRGGREIVEDGDLVALFEQQLAGALTNEAGPAGDQHLHWWGL